MTTKQKYDAVGWIGAIIILVLFAANSFIPNFDQDTYHAWNIIGAIFIAMASAIKQAWPATFLNVAWAAISIVSLIMLFN